MADILTYSIQYQPEKFVFRENSATEMTPRYFVILSADSGREVGFAFSEDMAKTMCLALELVRAQIYGDKKKSTALLKLIDKLSGTIS